MRLDLVLQDRCAYTYEGYSSYQVARALEKKGIPYKKIYLDNGVLTDYVHYLQEAPPSSMVSFVNFFFYEYPFCDFVQVPHFVWTKHSCSECINYLDAQYGKVGLPVAAHLPNTVYLPHGVDALERNTSYFDTVLFSSLIDLTCLEKMWADIFSSEDIQLIYRALETDLAPYEALKAVIPNGAYHHLMGAVESYQRGKHTLKAIAAFEGERLDIFGVHIGNNWLTRLPNAKRIFLHHALPYTECLSVLTQSKKIIINPLAPHWRLLAIAAGCTIVGEEPTAEQPKSWDVQVEQLIEYLHES